jgi:uncharacterized protein YbbK (DUF523 family)
LNGGGRPPTIVSACLIGVRCRYDGATKAAVKLDAQAVIPVCPEIMAGFGVPRPAIERTEDGRVRVVETGEDVTHRLEQAALAIVALAEQHGARAALLKEYSPSCGSSWLKRRDGSAVAGQGLLTEHLRAAGLTVTAGDRP